MTQGNGKGKVGGLVLASAVVFSFGMVVGWAATKDDHDQRERDKEYINNAMAVAREIISASEGVNYRAESCVPQEIAYFTTHSDGTRGFVLTEKGRKIVTTIQMKGADELKSSAIAELAVPRQRSGVWFNSGEIAVR